MLLVPVFLWRRFEWDARCSMLDAGKAGFAEASVVKGAAVVAGMLDTGCW